MANNPVPFLWQWAKKIHSLKRSIQFASKKINITQELLNYVIGCGQKINTTLWFDWLNPPYKGNYS